MVMFLKVGKRQRSTHVLPSPLRPFANLDRTGARGHGQGARALEGGREWDSALHTHLFILSNSLLLSEALLLPK